MMKNYRQFKESMDNDLVDKILDKINKNGIQSLTIDEKTYLDQQKKGNIDKNLEDWLLDDTDETIDRKGNKILYNEFLYDEDLFWNTDKLIRIISDFLGKSYFTNNADWGGDYVWNIKNNDNYHGIFIFLGDNVLELIERKLDANEEYDDTSLRTISKPSELYKLFKDIKLNKI